MEMPEPVIHSNFSFQPGVLKGRSNGGKMNKQLLIAASAVFLGMAPLAYAQVVVRIGPPAHVVERVPPPPHEHPNWAWHEGYHRWDGNRYVWVPGRWELRRTGYRYVNAYWERFGRGWRFASAWTKSGSWTL